MAHLLAHLMGLSSCFLPAPNPQTLPKSIDIDIGWPTSLLEGEARWQQEVVDLKRMKEVRIHMVRRLKMN